MITISGSALWINYLYNVMDIPAHLMCFLFWESYFFQ